MSYFSHAPHTRAARDAQTADDGPAEAATAASLPAATAARLTATAATASQLRRLASERTTEQKGKRRRQHGGYDPDGATSESPALSEIDSACADHDASAASATLPGAATHPHPHSARRRRLVTAKRGATRQERLQAYGPQGSASGSDQRNTPPPPSPGSPQDGGPSAGSRETAPRLVGVGPSASVWEPAPWIDPKHPPPYARWPGTLGS